MAGPSPQVFITPEGGLVEMTPEQAVHAPDFGYAQATPDQMHRFALERKYGTTGEAWKAFGESAASTATFGLSTHLEKALGVDPEAIKAREQFNPVASNVGTAAGFIAPLFIPGGQATAPGLITKAGRIAGAATREALPEATSLLGRAAAKVAERGAGSAVEGALWGTGQVIHEGALDPHLSAENALHQIGLSAILAGTLGGALGAGEVGIPAAIGKAREAAGRLVGAAGELESPYARLAGRFYGEEPETIQAIIRSKGQNLTEPKFRSDYAQKLAGDMQAQVEADSKAVDVYHRTMKAGVREAMLADASQPKALEYAQKTINDLRVYAERLEAQPELPQAYATKARSLADALERDLKGESDPYKLFTKIDDIKDNVYHYAKPQMDPFANEAARGFGDIHQGIRRGLEDPEIWGKAGAQQAAVNHAQSVYFDTSEALLKKFGTAGAVDAVKVESFLKQLATEGNIQGLQKGELLDAWQSSSKALHEQIEMAAKHLPTGDYDPKAVTALINRTGTALEDARQQASLAESIRRIGSGSHGMLMPLLESSIAGHILPGIGHAVGLIHAGARYLNPTRLAEVLGSFERFNAMSEKAVERASKALLRVPVGEQLERRAGMTGAQVAAKFDRDSARLRSLATNPELLAERLQDSVEHFDVHAPNIAQGLQVAAARAVSFLDSKIPTVTKVGPFGHDIQPSADAMAKFQRYQSAVEDPLSVLRDARAGRVSPEALETLQTVYPTLYSRIQTQLVSAVTQHREQISYQQRLIIGRILGQPIDWSTTMAGVATLQGIHQQSKIPPPPPAPKPKGSSAAVGKMKTAERSQTPMQAALDPNRK